ncbi:MAG: hypothetical protein TR69_WS6001000601 [candidate division WS6 bacterium OLB20]|uniref:Uncharacterized protein n=1 Tax=candidate division WS6 bacterium OLB20 TaxID=1617426 RepID=A0A136LY73_9BACT|nr:MAG: hypothetical protein TR69_WS6001000601 [candidate division WS6 bacterium OLB20]
MEFDALVALCICGGGVILAIVSVPFIIIVAVLKSDTDKNVDTKKPFTLDRQKEIT